VFHHGCGIWVECESAVRILCSHNLELSAILGEFRRISDVDFAAKSPKITASSRLRADHKILIVDLDSPQNSAYFRLLVGSVLCSTGWNWAKCAEKWIKLPKGVPMFAQQKSKNLPTRSQTLSGIPKQLRWWRTKIAKIIIFLSLCRFQCFSCISLSTLGQQRVPPQTCHFHIESAPDITKVGSVSMFLSLSLSFPLSTPPTFQS